MRVWVFRRTRVLGGQQGFLDLEDHLAARLVAAGYARATFDGAAQTDPDNAAFADDDGTPPPRRKSPRRKAAPQRKPRR